MTKDIIHVSWECLTLCSLRTTKRSKELACIRIKIINATAKIVASRLCAFKCVQKVAHGSLNILIRGKNRWHFSFMWLSIPELQFVISWMFLERYVEFNVEFCVDPSSFGGLPNSLLFSWTIDASCSASPAIIIIKDTRNYKKEYINQL